MTKDNWQVRHFYRIQELVLFVNHFKIERFGIIADSQGFWSDGYYLIY